MYQKETIETIVNKWIDTKDVFIVDIIINRSNAIKVEIDSNHGIGIVECIELTNFIHANLDREKEDYELEVSSPGLGQKFKVIKQYFKNIGEHVEVTDNEGKKIVGKLKSANEKGFNIEVEKKVKRPGEKKAVMEIEELSYTYSNTKSVKNIIDFKSLK